MSLLDILQDRMVKVMPLPEPPVGPRTARIRLKAAIVAGPLTGTPTAPAHQEQVGYAIQSLAEGAHLTRVDAAPTVWDTTKAATWRFSPVLDTQQGAQNAWLDRWGSVLQQPRLAGETDAAYAPRILSYAIAPVTTNVGMANAIDQGVGLVGTIVQEATTFYTIIRANEGYRANNGIRANNAPGLTDTPWACFVVKLPQDPPAPYTYDTVLEIANRSKAAGTRCLSIIQVAAHWVAPTWVDPTWVQ